MRGRPTCPTGQKKNTVEATGGSPRFLLLQGKVGYRIAPSSDPASPAHLPPKGKALGREEPSVADFRPSQGPEPIAIHFLTGSAGQKILLIPRVPGKARRGSGCHPPNFRAQRSGSEISYLTPTASSQFPYGTASLSGWSGGSARPGCGPGGRHVPGRPRSTGSWGSCPRR